MAELRFSDSSLGDSRRLQTGGRSSLSSTSLACVADLVRWYLPVRTLVQFQLVSKKWRAWCGENLLQLAKQRRKDESSDWYFPLAFGDRDQRNLSGSRKWYGLHQGTKVQHTLPDLGFLPFWDDDPRFDYDLEAVSSGLLVFSKCPNYYTFILIVCNPLSKKWRRLPGHRDCKDRGMMSLPYVEHAAFGRIHSHLVVDDLSNDYKVIRLSTECVNVYSSCTYHWVCSPYDHPYTTPLAYSSVCFKGRVYILNLVEAVSSSWYYILRIYDIESGAYVIKLITFNNFNTQDFLDKKYWQRPRDPILVECIGELFAIAASCQARHNQVERRKVREIHSVKIRFHIFKLTEEGRLLEGSWNHVEVPVEMQLPKWDVQDIWEGCRHFKCVTRSNMICLAWRYDNHLDYDLVSGLHRMYTATGRGYPIFRGHNMAYTPSLDLEP